MAIAFVFMGGSVSTAVLLSIGFGIFGLLWKLGAWLLGFL